MKRRSRLTKKNHIEATSSTCRRSEEQLLSKPTTFGATRTRKQSTSEPSLLLYKQLNRVIDVLKYDFKTHAEGPSLKNYVFKSLAEKDEDDKMSEQEDNIPVEGNDDTLAESAGAPAEAEAESGAPDPTNEASYSPDSPPVPPPSPTERATEQDDKKKEPVASPSDFPLYDSAVLKELREADARAAKAAKAIESVREQLAVYANKEEMTEEDIKMMQAKQAELMEKMTEFEDITKRVQHLVGLVDVASSQLGPPEKPMVPMVEGGRGGPPGKMPSMHPEDTLPKVIVCGTGDIDQVPKIIVCEPTKARDGKHPLYQQIQGSTDPSRQKRAPSPYGHAPIGDQPGQSPYGNMPGQMPCPGAFPGMYPGMQGLGMPGMMPGPGMMGPGQQFMFPPGVQGPFGQPPPGMMMPPTGPSQLYGPGPGGPIPPCPPHSTKKKKDKSADKEYRKTKELCEKLTASLKMTEKLAEENTELEGSRYQLQEAVLNKDKQYEGLMLQLDSLKMEMKNVVNENLNLKKLVNKKAQGDQKSSSECPKSKPDEKQGLCKKDLQNIPICKAEVYKEMGLPVPGPGNRPQCPGAKFAASMGWNENQGCRNELNKSMCGTDMKYSQQEPGTGHGCGDTPVVCKTQQCLCRKPPETSQASNCKKSDMAEIVQTMEQEVKSLQKELELVQAERRGLALQKKLLQCMADAGLPPTAGEESPQMSMESPPRIMKQYMKANAENSSAVELQLSSLREQYRKLQEDYTSKVEEVSMVRVEYDAAKRDALALLEKCREAESRVDDLLQRLRVIEQEKSRMAGSKDQMTELEQQLTIAKQRYREGQEELEELKTTMQDQMLQLEEYRSKYLSAQQTVEEQRRQIDIMELENNRISEQVNLEIQRVKTQFQEKLQELTPLPDMLKATQLKLQECDQLKLLAERNVEQLMNQMDELKEQNQALEKELDELKKSSDYQSAEKTSLRTSLTTGEKKIEEIKSENNKLRATVARLEEVALNNERRLDEKNHEVLQLQTQLETLREESARQVSRTKDRCEAVRRTLQSQISQLECQLAQSRAAARTAQKDRDEVRQRMQAQITSLNDNFEQAQMRIRSLQSHVNYLKSSYTNIFAPEMGPMCPKQIDGLSSF